VYHSALKPALNITQELDYYRNDRGVVFAWDLTQGIHELFRTADAIYAEPAWRAGYAKFLARAGAAGTSDFRDYLYAIRATVEMLHIPTYIVIGKHMLKMLHPPEVVPVKIHGYGALAAVWHARPPRKAENIDDLCDLVCAKHETVLDFSCGYGSTARKASRFVCSDINLHCVYVVAKEIMGYDG